MKYDKIGFPKEQSYVVVLTDAHVNPNYIGILSYGNEHALVLTNAQNIMDICPTDKGLEFLLNKEEGIPLRLDMTRVIGIGEIQKLK